MPVRPVNPLEDAAQALMALALALPVNAEIDADTLREAGLPDYTRAILEGRTGAYGSLNVTPMVEIDDGRTAHSVNSQGDSGTTTLGYLDTDYYVLIWLPGPRATQYPERQKKFLRSVTWALWEAIHNDPTLSGAVEYVRAKDSDFQLVQNHLGDGRDFWLSRTRVTVSQDRVWR